MPDRKTLTQAIYKPELSVLDQFKEAVDGYQSTAVYCCG
jgi:hypothetical protein